MTTRTDHSGETRPQMNLRLAGQDRALFDLAAQTLGTTRSEFILSASRRMAEATLMDRTFFPVNEEAWQAFHAVLDAPHANPNGLDKLKSTPLPWKR